MACLIEPSKDFLLILNGSFYREAYTPVTIPITASPFALTHRHLTVQQAAGSRFASAHYSDAILAACTALDKAVQAKTQRPDLNGKQLMDVGERNETKQVPNGNTHSDAAYLPGLRAFWRAGFGGGYGLTRGSCRCGRGRHAGVPEQGRLS